MSDTILEVSDGVSLDFDEQGRLIGLEVLGAAESYPLSDIFNLINGKSRPGSDVIGNRRDADRLLG